AADPQSIRPIHDSLLIGEAAERARHQRAAMTESRYTIAEFLKTPIAIVSDRGEIYWRNRSFEAVFADAGEWLRQASRAVRGPLSGIQGTLEFVLSAEGAKIDSIYTDLLQEAQRESERMMNLINELLDFSKIQSGSFTVETEPVRVAGLLKRAVRSLQTVASRDEVFLLSAHGRDIPQILGSVEKLTQAVINLISNSLKFTPKKGLISV